MHCTAASRALALLLVPLLSGLGCSLDKGPSGDIPPQIVFLEAEGCLTDDPDAGPFEPFPVIVPFDLAPRDRMEVELEVLRGEMDLVVGTENPPSDYFAFGRGAGTQKILVGPDSREPLVGSPWFVSLISPLGTPADCEIGDEPDWRLSVRRASGVQGRVILEAQGVLDPSAPDGLVTEEVPPVEVPDDALSMEFVLESLRTLENREQGDADLFLALGGEEEGLVSLNPGPGYDVVVLDPGRCVPLRGQSVTLVLESWQQTTEYRLQAAYVAGEPEEQLP